MNPIWAVCQKCLIRCSFNCEANPAELEAKRRETARLCSWDSSAYVQHIQTIPQFLERKTVLLTSQNSWTLWQADGPRCWSTTQHEDSRWGGFFNEFISVCEFISVNYDIYRHMDFMFILLLFLFWFFSYLQLVQLFLACNRLDCR